MATRKNIRPTTLLSTVHADAVALVAGVNEVFGRATEQYRAFASLLVLGRSAVNEDGSLAFPITIDDNVVADWRGQTQQYRDWTSKVYADGGITDKVLLRKVQSSVRNHVSEIAKKTMKEQNVDFVLYGLDEASQNDKQATNKAKSVKRVAKDKPTETASALTEHFLDPKGLKNGAVQLVDLLHNQLVTLKASSVAFDQQADLARAIARLIATATSVQNMLTGGAVKRPTATAKPAAQKAA